MADRKSVTLAAGTKVTGPAEVVDKVAGVQTRPEPEQQKPAPKPAAKK